MVLPVLTHGPVLVHHGPLLGASHPVHSTPGFHADVSPSFVDPGHGVYCGHVGAGYTTPGGHVSVGLGANGCVVHPPGGGWHASAPTWDGSIGINF